MSYNVFSLFKNVPVDITIETLADKPFRDNRFNRSCYKKPTFPIQRNLDKQVVVVAMGSPQGPLIANAFMCHIEEKSENQNKMPAFYKPYVKDTLSKMPNVSSASVFLPKLNEIYPSLSFAMELKNNRKLPFSGMTIRNSPQLHTKVYLKPSDTGL